MHPAIYRLMPFVRVPACIPRTDPGYLATIIDCAVPVFETVHRAHPHVQHTRTLMILLANINRFVLAVKALVPHRAHDEWFAFVPPGGSATSPRWDTYPSLYANWLFPGTEEFPDDQPLRDPLSGKANNSRDTDRAVHLLNEAIDPQITLFQTVADEFRAGRLSPAISQRFFNTVRALIEFLPSEQRNSAWTHDFLPEDPDFANLFLTTSIAIPRAPHEDTLEDPYPIKDMSSFDPIWYWWKRLQEEYRPQGEGASPRPTSDSGSRAGTYSPHYVPTTPPELSPTPVPGQTTPPAQTGNSAVGSASFDIRQLLRSAGRNTPTPHKASVIAASPPDSIEMQVDSPEMSSANALAIAEALDDPPPRCGPPRAATRGKRAPRQGAPLVQPAPASLCDIKGRPMIKTRSSQRSVTPPASEAYNEEGEEEKEDEEEEEEEEEPIRPAKRQRTSSSVPKGRGRGKAKAATPAPSAASSRFPLVERKTRGKRKKDELPPYVPPRPVPTMDTVRLAAESLAKEQHKPTVVVQTASFAIAIASMVNRGCCVTTAIRDASPIAPTPSPSRSTFKLRTISSRGNELLLNLSAARIDYELARESLFRASSRLAVTSNRAGAWIREVTASLGADGLPGMAEIPEELQLLWGQLLLDSQSQLTVDYRVAIMQYPFLSDTRSTEPTSDDDLQQLLDILARRTARNQQSTPPPVENSNWPEEDEAGPSGSK
ncbi:hypothetical protein B0H14DRAFT_3425793 [Mycena olivaceomarginata]|nr:hypothetical protein B0H14DRAFT_3425793 [Mycena olivaceomarginata]